MRLTPEQESSLVDENMAKIYRAVDNFTARCSRPVVRVPYEDFVQESALAYLNYIRRCETEEQLAVFPWYDCMNAMLKLVQAYQPVTCPSRNTSAGHTFADIVASMPKTVSYETAPVDLAQVDGMSRHWVDDKDTMMDFELFLATLPDYADRIFAMKLGGLSSRKIAGQLGVTECQISRRLKKYHEQYRKFTEEEDENAEPVS